MRIKALFIGGAMFLLLGFTGLASGVARELPQYLLAIPEVQDIDTLETSDFFSEKYLVLFKQEIDHGNPDAGYFTQRVFISHYGFNSPVVYTTEGYTGSYAEMPGYVNELSAMFEANQIVVEHRYFDQSVPEP
ncbi:MAG TPA: aminopeptidase, partial [Bacteroidales bacterium]|nr:aminopeptidase [Bacteroidales bacterium]